MLDAPYPEGMLEDITRFFAAESNRPAGLDLYDDCFETGLFFPLQRKNELRRMIQIARSINPRTVFEIGADKGAGIYHWVKCLPTVRNMVVSEIRGTPYASLFEEAFPKIDFLWDSESSHATPTIKRVKNWLGPTPIDVLFIDGDKTRTVRDFESYLPLMNSQGVVFIHDIQDHEPMHAFAEIRDRYKYPTQTVVDTRECKAALLRQVEVLPPRNAYEGWLQHWRGMSCGVGCIFLDKKGIER